MLQIRGGRRKEEAQHLGRRAGNGPALCLEFAPSADADTLRGRIAVGIGILDGHHRTVLRDAQRRVDTRRGEYVHVIRGDEGARLLLPPHTRGCYRLLRCVST